MAGRGKRESEKRIIVSTFSFFNVYNLILDYICVFK
jgi:hypothetical protein